ncbi:TonB-dependent receptor [Hymenobacter sp. BT770]|uniref:TonB-dependent receptor n=1 Tax=Hymenobacter sp. BT770 TaxID=2886942 RepID=UPI001D11699B|nr:TonB-dependent receptor [Hymenobacter sp. BT770]MCC3151617.1 TonB-dependent receptor [Hymenobacter sp. BT770]MDO3413806.1 TonB-dependent receptor [Hymenobacter sp. BT770]
MNCSILYPLGRGLVLLWLAAAPGWALAQTPAAVRGTVATPTGAPVEFATLTLHRAADSVVVKTEFSDVKGAFQFDAVPLGRYLVSAAQVGFVRYWAGPLEVPAGGLTLPAFALQTSEGTKLKEVVVVGQKPLFEREADRTVVNVEGSTLAAGNTTLDVLSRAPGVSVTNDNLALRGKQGLLVMIDGKRQPMSGSELADYLRALPAEQVRSIELITNPPAKYDAQGGAGIIAINLKKDQRQGTNGTANLGYGRGVHGRFTTGLSANYRRQKVNLFGSYNYSDRRTYSNLTLHRDFFEQAQPTGTTDQLSYNRLQNQAHNFRGGLDYSLSERTVLGVAVSGLRRTGNNVGTNATQVYGPDGALRTASHSESFRTVTTPNFTSNVNFRHTFPADSGGTRELSGDINYATYHTRRQQGLATVLDGPAPAPASLVGDQTGLLTIQSAKADYVWPLTHQRRLEMGAKASHVASDNDVRFHRTENGQTSVDLTQTNRFRYDEQIQAAYLSFAQAWPKTKLQLGLRAEQTLATGRQDVGNEGFDRRYAQLFPSGSLTRTLSDRHTLAFSLSRRIDRPSYGQLNPFRIYLDATTYGSGNTDLLPQTSYNLELTHTLRQKFSSGLSYSNTRHPIIEVVQPESATSRLIVSRPVNLATQHYFALTLTAPLEPLKGWNVYNNAVLYYSQFVGDLAGTALNRGRLAFNLSSTSTVALPRAWTLDVNATYQSREQYGFNNARPLGQLTLGAQKSLWDRKATLKLNVTDVLYTNIEGGTSAYNNYVERFRQPGDSRVATLTLTYRFGNDKLAPARRRTDGAEDEKRRAGG